MAVEPLILNVADLCKWTGASDATLRSWKRQGKLPETPNGRIDGNKLLLAGIQSYRNKAAGVEEGETSLEDAKIRLTIAQAQHREMLNDRVAGSLIFADDMEMAVTELITAARSRLLGIPTQAAPRLVGVTDPLEAQRVLKELISDALRELSGTAAIAAVLERGSQPPNSEGDGPEDHQQVGAPP